MANPADETKANLNTQDNDEASNDEVSSQDNSEQQSDGVESTDEGKIADTSHNTGKQHMSIDEEGSEVGPDDEV